MVKRKVVNVGRICPRCGSRIPDGMPYCPVCGWPADAGHGRSWYGRPLTTDGSVVG